MTDPEQDDVFEAYLKRRAVLPALDNKIEPPAALDTAVLAKAREAIQPAAPSSTRTRLPMGRPARWAVPVALAATILLCLSVVMNISLNTNRRGTSANLERMAAARADSKASALSNATAESNAAAGINAPGSGAAQDRFADNGERPQSVSGEIASREVVLPRAKVVGVQAPRAPIEVDSVSSANASSADAASALSTMTTMTASTARSAPTTGADRGPAAIGAGQGLAAPGQGPAAPGQGPAAPGQGPAATGQGPAAASAAATNSRAAAPPVLASANGAARQRGAAALEESSTSAANSSGNLTPTPSASAAFASTNSERRIASPFAAASAQPGDASGATGEASGTKAAQSPADEPRVAATDKAVMMAKRAGVAAPEYTPAPEAARTAGQAVVTSEAARAAGQAVITPEAARTADQAVVTSEAAVVARAADQAASKSEATSAPGRAGATSRAPAVVKAAAAHPVDPKVWLQQIDALRAAGKKDQAEAEMRRFKAAFPDYAIPVAPTVAPAGSVSPTPDLQKK